jgi:hypothetical protein
VKGKSEGRSRQDRVCLGHHFSRGRLQPLPFGPAGGVAFHVHNGDNKDDFVLNLIDDAIRKFVGEAASCARRMQGQASGKAEILFSVVLISGVNLYPNPETLGVIVDNCLKGFLFHRGKGDDVHLALSSDRTAVKGRAHIFPAAKPSRRDSASSAHN